MSASIDRITPAALPDEGKVGYSQISTAQWHDKANVFHLPSISAVHVRKVPREC